MLTIAIAIIVLAAIFTVWMKMERTLLRQEQLERELSELENTLAIKGILTLDDSLKLEEASW